MRKKKYIAFFFTERTRGNASNFYSYGYGDKISISILYDIKTEIDNQVQFEGPCNIRKLSAIQTLVKKHQLKLM